MSNIVILRNGMAVNLTDSFPEDSIVCSIDGFLTEFQYNAANGVKKYRYYTVSDFKIRDIRNSIGIDVRFDDYYLESTYLKYIQDGSIQFDNSSLNEVLKTRFPFHKFRANAGVAKVYFMDYGPPFNFYFKRTKALFTVKKDQLYAKLYEDQVVLPATGVQITQDNFNDNDSPEGQFYRVNFGDVQKYWTTITDDEKKVFCKIVTLITFKIFWIVKEIFPRLLTEQSYQEIDEMASSNNTNIDNLTLLQQVIFTLKYNWGYYYDPKATSATPFKNSLTAILPNNPDYHTYSNYLRVIDNFYSNLYTIADKIRNNSDEDDRLSYLIELLPVTSVAAIPYPIRIKVLRRFCDKKNPSDEDQAFALRVVYSFLTNTEVDDFFDFLLLKENGTKTNFEALYRNMNDSQLFRYSLIVPLSWVSKGATNRKYFIYSLYDHWKKSKYYAKYIPPGVTPNADLLNPNAFFLSEEGALYFDNVEAVLEYYSEEYGFYNYSKRTITYKSEIVGKELKVNKLEKSIASTILENGVSEDSKSIESFFSTYHLFQPISLIGYLPDSEIEMPSEPVIPAFLFHYVLDFDKLKEFHEGFALAINVSTEIALFFVTGGVSAIKDLTYLKYVNKLGKAIRGTGIAVTEMVEVWRGLEAGSIVASLPASIISSTCNYIAVNANDPKKASIARGLSRFFLYLTFGTVASGVYSRVKATAAAEVVLDSINQLPAGTSHGLSQEMIDLLTTVKGARQVTTGIFANRLGLLDFQGYPNRILPRYNLMTTNEKLAFWRDFNILDDIKDIKKWRELNVEYSKIVGSTNVNYTLVDIWQNEVNRLKNLCRNNVEFLKTINSYKYLRTIEFEKFKALLEINGKWVGGHLGEALFDTSRSIYATINPNIGVRNFFYKFNGKDVIYKQVRNGITMHKGLITRAKTGLHTWVANLTEDEYLEEVAYAFIKRVNPMRENGVRTKYASTFSDGCSVTLIVEDTKVINGVTYYDYTTAILIKP